MVPVASSAAGAKPASCRTVEHFADRCLRDRHGRCQHAQSEVFGGGRGLGEQRRILASHERRGHADPQLTVPACDVVDQIRQTLRHRRFGVLAKQRMQFVGGLADVEGMPDRRFADPVHHRGSGGLDGRPPSTVPRPDDVPAGRAPPRSGRPAPESDRSAWAATRAIAAMAVGVVRAVDEHAAGRADRPAAHQAELLRFFQEVGDRRGLQPVRPARPPPDQRGRRGVLVDSRAGWQIRRACSAADGDPTARPSSTANPTARHRVWRPVRGSRSVPAWPPSRARWWPADASVRRSTPR